MRVRRRIGNRFVAAHRSSVGMGDVATWCSSPAGQLPWYALPGEALISMSLCGPMRWYGNLAEALSPLPKPPVPAPQTIAVTSAGAPGAVFAGNDANGNPVYLAAQSPEENQAATKSQLDQFFSQFGTSASGGSGSIDWTPILLIVGGVVGGALLFGGSPAESGIYYRRRR